jgi:hypothetical protein
MPLPEFTLRGELPPGVHVATIEEVLQRFGAGTAIRRRQAEVLDRIHKLASTTNSLDRVVVFGSFVTAKPAPNDVDVVLIMKDDFRLEDCPTEALSLFDHVKAQTESNASVFWIRPALLILDSLEQFIARWQITREGSPRGIVEIPG